MERTIDLFALGPGPHQEVDPGAPAATDGMADRVQWKLKVWRPIRRSDSVLEVLLWDHAVDVAVLGVEELSHPAVGRRYVIAVSQPKCGDRNYRVRDVLMSGSSMWALSTSRRATVTLGFSERRAARA